MIEFKVLVSIKHEEDYFTATHVTVTENFDYTDRAAAIALFEKALNDAKQKIRELKVDFSRSNKTIEREASDKFAKEFPNFHARFFVQENKLHLHKICIEYIPAKNFTFSNGEVHDIFTDIWMKTDKGWCHPIQGMSLYTETGIVACPVDEQKLDSFLKQLSADILLHVPMGDKPETAYNDKWTTVEL
jgi:hypothetical protein